MKVRLALIAFLAIAMMSGCCGPLNGALDQCMENNRKLSEGCGANAVKSAPAGLLTEVTDRQMVDVLEDLGLSPEFHEEGVVKFQIEGMKAIFFRKDQTLQCYAGFQSQRSLAAINEWNKNHRFSRAYMDNEGDLALEADINMAGGVTYENLKEFIRVFQISLNGFVEFMREQE